MTNDDEIRITLRLPAELRDRVRDAAEQSGRSMNAEIVFRIKRALAAPIALPTDLLHRIEAYASRQGRSANEEVLRVLEREYPKQWTLDDRMEQLADMLSVLAAGTADARIDDFLRNMTETVQGVVSGRVAGVDDKAREEVLKAWHRYLRQTVSQGGLEDARSWTQNRSNYDDEERTIEDLIGSPEKYAIPRPPIIDQESVEEREIVPEEDPLEDK